MSDPRYVATGLPTDWTSKLAKYVLRERSEKGYPEEQLLSASQKYGVVPQSFLERELDRQVMTATKGFENFKLVEPGDFVISLRTFEGGIEFSDHRGIISSAYTVMTPAQALHHGYYRYYLKSEELISRIQAVTTGIREGKTVRYDDFCTLEIPIPPTETQEAIASFLDRETARIDALIEKKQRQIELLQEKRATLISHAVTKGLDPNVKMKDSGIEWLGEVPEHWKLAPLYAHYHIELGKMLDTKRITGITSMPYLRNIDVQWDLVNTENLPEMDIPASEYDRYTLREGDILVCEGGEVGRTAIWHEELPICGYQKAIHRVRPRNIRNLPRFFFHLMKAATHSGVFLANGNPNTIPHLTGEQFRRYRFPFPPIEEQKEIASFLDATGDRMMRITNKVIASIDLLREYRTALISAAVTGKIDVRKEVV